MSGTIRQGGLSDTWANNIVRFAVRFRIERPVVLGTSFGGFVAIHYAARHPQHPSKVVLSSTLAVRDVRLIERRFLERGGPDTGGELPAIVRRR